MTSRLLQFYIGMNSWKEKLSSSEKRSFHRAGIKWRRPTTFREFVNLSRLINYLWWYRNLWFFFVPWSYRESVFIYNASQNNKIERNHKTNMQINWINRIKASTKSKTQKIFKSRRFMIFTPEINSIKFRCGKFFLFLLLSLFFSTTTTT